MKNENKSKNEKKKRKNTQGNPSLLSAIAGVTALFVYSELCVGNDFCLSERCVPPNGQIGPSKGALISFSHGDRPSVNES